MKKVNDGVVLRGRIRRVRESASVFEPERASKNNAQNRKALK